MPDPLSLWELEKFIRGNAPGTIGRIDPNDPRDRRKMAQYENALRTMDEAKKTDGALQEIENDARTADHDESVLRASPPPMEPDQAERLVRARQTLQSEYDQKAYAAKQDQALDKIRRETKTALKNELSDALKATKPFDDKKSKEGISLREDLEKVALEELQAQGKTMEKAGKDGPLTVPKDSDAGNLQDVMVENLLRDRKARVLKQEGLRDPDELRRAIRKNDRLGMTAPKADVAPEDLATLRKLFPMAGDDELRAALRNEVVAPAPDNGARWRRRSYPIPGFPAPSHIPSR
jgi:hypothetical protein